jgi:glycyl-tRNA synthetase beta chain
LADKLDTLVGFFAIDEKPTGSKDPFALRRAALGVVRTLLTGNLKISLGGVARAALNELMIIWNSQRGVVLAIEALSSETAFRDQQGTGASTHDVYALFDLKEWASLKEKGSTPTSFWFVDGPKTAGDQYDGAYSADELAEVRKGLAFEVSSLEGIVDDIAAFFADRLKVTLKDQGKRHDLVDAVFAPINGRADDDLVRIVARVEALDGFLKTDDGKTLMAGYKRASNILKAEEKKGWKAEGDRDLLDDASAPEVQLHDALRLVEPALAAALKAEDFTAAMQELAGLRGPVDAFLDGVFVNSDVAAERDNRLKTLAAVRDAMGQVADFSLIAG